MPVWNSRLPAEEGTPMRASDRQPVQDSFEFFVHFFVLVLYHEHKE